MNCQYDVGKGYSRGTRHEGPGVPMVLGLSCAIECGVRKSCPFSRILLLACEVPENVFIT